MYMLTVRLKRKKGRREQRRCGTAYRIRRASERPNGFKEKRTLTLGWSHLATCKTKQRSLLRKGPKRTETRALKEGGRKEGGSTKKRGGMEKCEIDQRGQTKYRPVWEKPSSRMTLSTQRQRGVKNRWLMVVEQGGR